MTPHEQPPPWGDLARVAAAALLFFIAFGALLPVFPLWVGQFTGSFTGVGLATTLSVGLGLLVARPLAARMMEGRRRAPTLITGALIATAVSLVFPLIESLPLIVALRCVHGVGFGLVTTAAVSAITDLSPPSRRGEIMGYFGATNSLSLLIGPLIGAAMWRHFGAAGIFGFCAAGCLLSAASVLRLREPPKAAVVGAVRLRDALVFPGMRLVVGAHFLAILLHGGLMTFLPARMEDHVGWMTPEAFYAIDAAVLILLRVAIGRRFDLFTRAAFARIGLACLAAAGLLLGLTEGDTPWCIAAALYGLGFGAYVPAVSALVGDLMPPTHRARGFAAFMLAFDLALACGGVAVGPAADVLGVGDALLVASVFPLLAMVLYVVRAPAEGKVA